MATSGRLWACFAAALVVCEAAAGDAKPVISLDLGQVPDEITKVIISKASAAICHKKQEWQTLLYGGDKGWVAKQCQSDDPTAEKSESYAKRCNVLHANETNCPEPTAQAFDHHNGVVEVTVKRKLFVKSDPHQAPEKVDKKVVDISYSQRGEYLVEFDAEDSSGNSAETVHFAMILQDIMPPVVKSTLPTQLEACLDFQRYLDVSSFAVVTDEYDKDCSDTLTISITHDKQAESSSTIDTTLLGEHTVSYGGHDYAQIFGLNNKNNQVVKVIKVTVVDTTGPIVFCKTSNETTTCDTEAGSLVCSNAVPCAKAPPTILECGTAMTSSSHLGAVCLDFHDSLNHDGTISTTALTPSSPNIDTSVPMHTTLTYTCADGAYNTGHGSRPVHIMDHTAPTLKLTDNTDLNLVLQLHCGTPGSLATLAKAIKAGATAADATSGYYAEDDCGNHHCSVDLYPGNCGGTFSCYNSLGDWVMCDGGPQKSLPSLLETFSDGTKLGTYGLKYTCEDGEGLTVSKCRTVVNIDSETCNPPPIHCIVSEWNAWSTCSKTCDGGSNSRTRTVVVDAQYGGTPCPADLKQNQQCNPSHCDMEVESSFTAQAVLNDVTKSDFDEAMGTKFQHAFSLHTAMHWETVTIGFLSLGNVNGTGSVSEDCSFTSAVHTAVVGDTESVVQRGRDLAKQCSTTCKIEKTLQEDPKWTAILAKVQAGHDAKPHCDFDKCVCSNGAPGVLQMQVSEVSTETWRDCKMSPFSDWSACSTTCGDGKSTRTRTIDVTPVGDRAAPCTVTEQSKACHITECPEHCDWQWENWGDCSVSCAPGVRSREPTIIKESKHGGITCPETEYETCDMGACPIDCQVASWSGWSWCSHSCGTGAQTRERKRLRDVAHGGVACGPLKQQRGCNTEKCPVDCEMGTWESWADCSVTCGTGTQKRTRPVDKPTYAGGKVCDPSFEDRDCNTEDCPIDCTVSTWGTWASCPKSCGGNTHSHYRTIIVSPEHGGVGCPPLEAIETCGIPTCPEDCVVGAWVAWTECTASCGTGQQSRSREITSEVQDGGIVCPTTDEDRSCNTQGCPLDCHVTRYDAWGDCTTTCGSGSRTRTRSISRYPQIGGSACPGLVQTEFCNIHACPLDCVVGQWGEFGPCSVTCGGGSKTRSRSIARAQNGGMSCPTTLNTRGCNLQKCPVNCHVARWSEWSECSVTCGSGIQYRLRDIKRPQWGGRACPISRQERGCNSQLCPVDCVMSRYTHWSDCTVSCGTGTQSRSRTIRTRAAQGGVACPHAESQQNCDNGPCPVDCDVNAWSDWTSCTLSCGSGSQSRSRTIQRQGKHAGVVCPMLDQDRGCNDHPCPIDCVIGNWHDWSDCSLSCGSGHHSRTRTNTRPLHGGAVCPSPKETRFCNAQSCPLDCEMESWSDWSHCSTSCGTGSRTRTRAVGREPDAGGVRCPTNMQSEACNTNACPVNCIVAAWNEFGQCSTTCGGGSHTRTRTLTAESYGGVKCPTHMHVTSCNRHQCPIDCVSHSWTAWSHCTKSCATGTQYRTHSFTTQPKYGGKACPVSQQIRHCNTQGCPIDCSQSLWSIWPDCSKSCGTGTQSRSRSVLVAAENGGVACANAEEHKSCTYGPCPVDCDVTAWTEWGGCTVSCNSGSQSRTREIFKKGNGIGVVCPYLSVERSCNDQHCALDCVVGEFDAWSDCTLSCGSGRQTRTRTNVAPQHGGVLCPAAVEDHACNTQSCPADCGVTRWGDWDECTASCGSGSRTRTRAIGREQGAGGNPCPALSQTEFCNIQPCAVDCIVGDWTPFGPCSATCGGGSKTRTRTVSPGGHGGVACPTAMDISECGIADCPVDCVVTQWTVWSQCTASCGNGTQHHTRSILQPQFGGKACPVSREDRDCNTSPCPVDCEMSAWGVWPDCSHTCDIGRQTRERSIIVAAAHGGISCSAIIAQHQSCNEGPCPVHCEVTSWEDWVSCSLTCGSGSQNRKREIARQGAHGGVVCPSLGEQRSCNEQSCAADCVVGRWEEWTECSVSCGNGQHSRTRTIAAPQHGGVACPHSYEARACNAHFCPIDCAVGEWNDWTHCSATCGGGAQFRWRALIHASFGGIHCPQRLQNRACNEAPCTVDCLMSPWTDWSACSRSCGDGTRQRRRTVNRKSAFGGKACKHDQMTSTCNGSKCPVDCAVGTWSVWDTCTHTCGGGSQMRLRPTTEEQHGGNPCSATIKYRDYRMCNEDRCPVDCAIGSWTTWSPCSRSCSTPEYEKVGELGTVTVTQTEEGVWQSVQFKSRYVDPAVVIGIPSANGNDSIMATIKDVTSTGFKLKLAKPLCDAKIHTTETMDWMAVEKGSWKLSDGTKIEAGEGWVDSHWTDFNFHTAFKKVPVVLTQIQNGQNGDYFTHARHNSVSLNGFSGLVQPAIGHEAHGRETLGFVSIEQGNAGPLAPFYEAGFWQPDHNNKQHIVNWRDGIAKPMLFAAISTESEPNLSTLRQTSVGNSGSSIFIKDNKCTSADFGSTGERISYLATTPGLFPAISPTPTQVRTRALYPPTHGGAPCTVAATTSRPCNAHHCPVDCAVGTWSQYSTCSKSCGGGSQSRIRSVTQPFWGGVMCPGVSSLRACNEQHCPEDCQVTSWTAWSSCSATCGVGTTVRTRSVEAPVDFGGVQCPVLENEKYCNVVPCSVDCTMGTWSEWSTCTKTCGEGSHTRTRVISIHTQHGGVACPSKSQVKPCESHSCPVDCVMSKWARWHECSVTCEAGVQSRSRKVLTPASNGGLGCPSDHLGVIDHHEKPCNLGPCPVDCDVGPWTAWSQCSKTCGGGSDQRTRKIVHHAEGPGWICPRLSETGSCNDDSCPIDCETSAWTAWNLCSRSCGTGSKTRTRIITQHSTHDGVQCGQLHLSMQCNTEPCAVDCAVSSWQPWGPCSTSCAGSQKRVRTTVRAALHGGSLCPTSLDQRDCEPRLCPRDCTVSNWSAWGVCSKTCGGGSSTRTRSISAPAESGGAICPGLSHARACRSQACPEDCSVGRWAEWSECTNSCAGGFATRSRTLIAAKHGGQTCPASEQTKRCNDQHCPVDCERGAWTDWNACTMTCGGGFQRRNRNVVKAAKYGGAICPDPNFQRRPCNRHVCPVDCQASLWSRWSDCDKTCGSGKRWSTRSVLRESQFGGKSCPTLKKSVDCHLQDCPVDCRVSAWASWGSCSLSCGDGEQTRARTVVTKTSLGGLTCPVLTSRRMCKSEFCPHDCQMGAWSTWSACSHPCGTGVKSRSRPLLLASSGGEACPSPYDDAPCNIHSCAIDCVQNTWSAWSSCTRSCTSDPKIHGRPGAVATNRVKITGSKYRNRVTTTPSAYGGKSCGRSTESSDCETQNCPRDCVVGSFEPWSICSASCSAGTYHRSRHVVQTAVYGGKACGALYQHESCSEGPCPVNCAVSAWAPWTVCSVTCGGGTRSRRRDITSQQTGASICPFLFLEETCNDNACVEDCEMSTWSAYSSCTHTCGTGSQTRTRAVKQEPTNGGAWCSALHQTRVCYTNPCPVNCLVSEWTDWSSCSLTCGQGYSAKHRSITKTSLFDGDTCPVLKKVKSCNPHPCPRDCSVSPYSAWTACSATCGAGVQTANRTITRQPLHGGVACPMLSASADCNDAACPGDCKLGDWEAWLPCSRTCGTGYRLRSRVVDTKPSNGGASCGVLRQSERCNTAHCPIDCTFSSWSIWSECSTSCGTGTKKRDRYLESASYYGGKECPHSSEVETCNTQHCPEDCEVGAWQDYSTCSVSCGTGTQTRLRHLTTPSYGGRCPIGSQSRTCNTFVCPVDCVVTAWTRWSTCTTTCGGGSQTRTRVVTRRSYGGATCGALSNTQACAVPDCPIDCVVGRFGNWSPCPVTCGGGTQTKTRTTLEPQYGGIACPNTLDEQTCAPGKCAKDCVEGDWTSWSDCTSTCNRGSQTRTRSLTRPQHGGVACGPSSETESCKTQDCPIHCEVSSWATYDECTKSCGGGTQRKRRMITKHAAFGGYTCPGLIGQERCNKQDCPIDCEVRTWGRWEACSNTCGTGRHKRQRSVRVNARFGGKKCPPLTNHDFCNTHTCAVDCEMGEWSVWSACSVSCNGGKKYRYRPTHITAQFGGAECGAGTGTASCNDNPCPIDCVMTPWSAWSECTRSCGTGGVTKTRSVKSPAEFNGADCGVETYSTQCDQGPCPVDCDTSNWSDWGDCSTSCGASGTQTRSRVITHKASHAGSVCPNLQDTLSCNQVSCPRDCAVSSWERWASCSTSCGAGSQTRSRFITRTPAHGGTGCPVVVNAQACNNHDCAVDCVVTPWGVWSSCSSSCGAGRQIRHRQVQRESQAGGITCPDDLQDERQCTLAYTLANCPMDCEVGVWGGWSACTQSCGSGVRSRDRTVTQPQYGGRPCPTTHSINNCNVLACPTHCESEWMDWTPCSAQCGIGHQTRPVKVITVAQDGGRECPLEQDRVCNTIPCPTSAPTPAPTSACYITATFKFPSLTQTLWDGVQSSFLGILGNMLTIDPIGMDVETEEIKNMTAVKDDTSNDEIRVQDRRLVADEIYNPDCDCIGFRVWVTFSVPTVDHGQQLLDLLRSSKFLEKLSVETPDYQSMVESVERVCNGPTTSPTAAPTNVPTLSPTYKAFPVVTVIGGNVVTVEASFSGQEYKDQGAMCTDLNDGDLSHTIIVTGTVDMTKFNADAQIINYTCTNSDGASQTARRFVYVHEGGCPHCIMHGAKSMAIEASFPFVDDGITCTDNFPHPNLQYSNIGHVDVEKAGTYKITYFATDRAGNDNSMCGQAPVIRTVAVVDTLKPVIGLKYRTVPLTDFKSSPIDISTADGDGQSNPGGQSNPAVDYFAGFMAEGGQSTSHAWLAGAIASFGCGVALFVRILRTRSDAQHPEMQQSVSELQGMI